MQEAAEADTTGRRSAALRALLSPILREPAVALNIALYAPLPHELNLLPLLHEHPQHHYAFPRCRSGRQLEFHEVTSPQHDFEPGALGIPAPAEHLPIILPQQLDIVIVPGVAFTRTGARLGYGGGYYDRFIPRCTQARILALAFPEQLVESIPTEEHDYTIPEILCLP